MFWLHTLGDTIIGTVFNGGYLNNERLMEILDRIIRTHIIR